MMMVVEMMMMMMVVDEDVRTELAGAGDDTTELCESELVRKQSNLLGRI